MGKTKPGRPKIMSRYVESALLQSFMHGLNTSEACDSAGIHRSTFYRYTKAHPEFADRVEIAKTDIVNVARRTVSKKITEGSLSTAKWYLSRKDPEFRYPRKK